MAIQAASALLDLLGILLIGLVGALAVTTVQSQPAPHTVQWIADQLGLNGVSDQGLVVVFAGAAAVVLLTKSILSSYLTRRVFKFLANRQALVSARLAKELLSRPLSVIQERSSQETSFALIGGANAATVQLLGQLVIAVSELALLLVLGVALLVLNPVVALSAIIFFALVAFALQRTMGGWASRVGTEMARADIASFGAIQEALGAYREISISDRRSLYVDRIQELRWQAARVSADSQFMAMFPKYMFEVALVVGGFVLAGVLFATQDSVAAVGTLALFLAAATRVMPSLLRLQGSALGMRTAAGLAEPTLALSADLGHPTDAFTESPLPEIIRARIQRGNPTFEPTVDLKAVTVRYPKSPLPALEGVSLSVRAGQAVALVGRSGAGKSTLADVILGVIDPETGSVRLGGVDPHDCVARWPGAVAYVPQEIVLANGSIRDNVALGLPTAAIDDDLVWSALRSAHLADYLKSQRDGLDTRIGEGGLRLSGGQRQRLGIARALYAKPRLLVLDEATSALDAETEHAITETMRSMEGQVTRILVAHRLSSVRGADLVVFLDGGRVAAVGTFEEVAEAVPEFRTQAELMGLLQ